MTTGLADRLTGGNLAMAPEPATDLSIAPQVSPMIVDAAPAAKPTADPCGRPLAAP